MDTGKIRIKDIAERAGVSVGTVDRVLHNRPNVSPKALEKVNKALEEMDYKPNMYASALAYNKSYQFFSLIPKHESEAYWEEVEEGANAACERYRDFSISNKVLYYNRFSPETFAKALNSVLAQNPDGVIMVPSVLKVTRRYTDQMHNRNIPFILLDSYMPDLKPLSFFGQDSFASGYSSSVTPNMLVNFLVETNTISYPGCALQLGSVVFFGSSECFLLAAMAYDRFTAICSPLLYSTKMSTQVCVQLLMMSYTGGFLNACSFTISFYSLHFCGPNQVNHFFCDFAPLVELSCSDISIPAVVPSFTAGSIIVVTAVVITVSYVYILITILRMHSTEGRHKAFSTCTSHLTAVTLFYGTITFIYVMPKSSYSTDQNKVVSVFYMVVIPMLNPLIYSLRNNEIKGALKRKLARKIFS